MNKFEISPIRTYSDLNEMYCEFETLKLYFIIYFPHLPIKHTLTSVPSEHVNFISLIIKAFPDFLSQNVYEYYVYSYYKVVKIDHF